MILNKFPCGGGAELERIEITTPPTRTAYVAGEKFDPAGMVVTAYYSDGESMIVHTYGFTPDGALTALETYVTVMVFSGGVTKTAQQPIKVFVSVSFAIDSPEVIAAIAESGLASKCYAVGDERTIPFGGVSYKYRILGFDHDDLHSSDARYNNTAYNGGKRKAAITIEQTQITDNRGRMDATSTTEIGWQGCEMRTSYLVNLLATLSVNWRNIIRTVSKPAAKTCTQSTIVYSPDLLFILSEIELAGSTTLSWGGEGTQYAYYKAGNSKRKNDSTPTSWHAYHLRSPRMSFTGYVYVMADGIITSHSATENSGTCPVFCV